MERSLEFLRLPTPDRGQILLAALMFLALFLGAILTEVFRRRYLRGQHLKRAWREVYRIAASKDLSDKELRLLERVVHAHSRHDPLGFVTVRRIFNNAVEAYLQTLAHDPVRLEQEGLLLRELRVRLGLDFVPVGQRIDTTRDLAPGQIILARRATDSRAPWLKVTVVRTDEAVLAASLDPGEAEGEINLLRPGEELACRMWREDDARYAFNCRIARLEYADESDQTAVSKSQREQQPDIIVLYHGTDFQRTQARAYFRVRHNQPVSVGIVPAPLDRNYDGVSARRPTTHIRGRIVNLSAGGLAVEVQQSLPQHVLIRVTLDMPETEPVTVTARIVGVSAVSGGRYLLRGAFVDISESDRDLIAQYVWRRQQPIPKSENVLI